MTCPPSLPARLAGTLLTAFLALSWCGPGHAAPQAAKAASASASQPTSAVKKKSSKGKSSKASAAKSKTHPRGRTTTKGAASKAAAAGPAASTPAAPNSAADVPPADAPPESGLRLPLMLRTTPALPDNPAALQSRLDGIVTAQGAAGQGASVDGVRQLGPDIYAFALHCKDAEQCQRLRLAIEEERDWVAGLQLDERRTIPKRPTKPSVTR